MGGTWLSERELALVDGAEKLSIDLPIPTQNLVGMHSRCKQ